MKKFSFFFVFSICCLNVYSQSIVLNSAQNQEFYELFNHFEDFKIIKFDQNSIWEQAQNKKNRGQINISFADVAWDILLTESPLLNSEYGLSRKAQQNSGQIATPYQGHVIGDTESQVSLTIGREFLFGNVVIDGKRYYMEPLHHIVSGAPDDLTVFYLTDDIIPGEEKTCGAIEVQQRKNSTKSSHNRFQSSSTGDCWETELAIASDFSMFQKYGSVEEVENHNIAVMNDVNTDYSGSFDDDIVFVIVTQFIVTINGGDPWNSSNSSGDLLNSFRSWGNNGGFGVNFDIGQLWTNRNFTGSTIGVAWVGAVCTSFKYHVLQDFNNNADLLRVLVSHEIGHNFDSGHDPGGSGTIMSPSVNNTDQWSAQSVNAIDDFVLDLLAGGGCLSPCGTPSGPVADFSSNTQQICAGETVIYNDLSTNADSWFWTFDGGTPANSMDQNPTVIYNESGVYDVTLEVGNEDGFDLITFFSYITVLDFPVADFNFLTNGLQVDFINTSSFGDEYFWDFGDGDISVDENPTHFYNLDGVYLVELTVTNDCGQDFITYLVDVGTPPIADFTSDIVMGCPGDAIQFINQSSDNTASWSWVFEGGSPTASTNPNPMITYANSGTYTVQLTVSNDYGEDIYFEDQYILIYELADASFSFAENGNTINFDNQSTNWLDIEWDFGDGDTSNIENPSHTYSIEGVYTVTLTVSNECGQSETTQNIVVGNVPVAQFGSDIEQGCPGMIIQFEDQSTSNATEWLWDFPGGNPNTSTDQHPTVIYPQSGFYDVTLTVFNDLGQNSITQTSYVEVFSEPVADFTSTVSGSDVSFNNTSTDWTTITWDFGDGNTSNIENPSHTYSLDGLYTVTLTVSNECGQSETTQNIVVGNVPVAQFGSDIIQGCPGMIVQFEDQSTSNATEWLWDFPGGNPTTSADQNPTVTYVQSGFYDVTLTVFNELGQNSITQASYVEVLSEPFAGFTSTVSGSDVSFNNTSTDWTTIIWDFGDGNTSDMENPPHTYSLDGLYIVTLTVSNECGQSQTTQNLTIGGVPTADFGTDVIQGCPGVMVQYTDMSSSNATSRLWSFPGGTPSTSTETNPLITYNQSGTYNAVLSVTNNLGSDSETKNAFISILELPAAEFNFTSTFLEFDFNNLSTNWTSLTWDFGDSTMSSDEDPQHSYAQAGEYNVVLTATNLCDESQFNFRVTATAQQMVSVAFTQNKNLLCTGQSVTYEDLTSPNANSRMWTFEGGTPATSSESNVTVMYSETGRYDVRLDVELDGDSYTENRLQLIQVIDVPIADFEILSRGNNQFQFNDLSDSQTGSYLWAFGDGATSAESNPLHTYAEPGAYEVKLTINNLCGTSDTMINTSTVVATNDLDQFNAIGIYPNPNNGEFTISWDNPEHGDVQIQIYDLLGRVVFNQDEAIFSGDNFVKKYRMNRLSSGTYFFKMEQKGKYIIKPLIIEQF